MANGLFPAFVRIFYHSPRAAHVMTVPTREWVGVPGEFQPGEFVNWLDAGIPADEMVIAFAESAQDAFFNDQVELDSYIIYHFPSETANPLPVYGANINLPGTLVDTGWFLGVQTTYQWRTTEFGLFKIVTLDGPSGDSFEDSTTWAAAGVGAAFNAVVTSTSNAWAGRDNGRPSLFKNYSRTLNDRALARYGDNPL